MLSLSMSEMQTGHSHPYASIAFALDLYILSSSNMAFIASKFCSICLRSSACLAHLRFMQSGFIKISFLRCLIVSTSL
jgi:hypothetical protein